MKVKIYYDALYSVSQVAIVLGVNEATVRSWIKSGKIEAHNTSIERVSFRTRGYIIKKLLEEDPRFDIRTSTVDIPDERATDYLESTRAKCKLEIDIAMRRIEKETEELNDVLKLMLTEQES